MRKGKLLFGLLILVAGTALGQDMIVDAITDPSDQCGHTSAQTVTIRVKNNGPLTANAPYTTLIFSMKKRSTPFIIR